jgi:tetrahydromethanopterin S-methyltransferase subunit A
MLESIPKEMIDRYNKDNTWNALGDAKTISELITVLKDLISSNNGLSDEMKKPLEVSYE